MVTDQPGSAMLDLCNCFSESLDNMHFHSSCFSPVLWASYLLDKMVSLIFNKSTHHVALLLVLVSGANGVHNLCVLWHKCDELCGQCGHDPDSLDVTTEAEAMAFSLIAFAIFIMGCFCGFLPKSISQRSVV